MKRCFWLLIVMILALISCEKKEDVTQVTPKNSKEMSFVITEDMFKDLPKDAEIKLEGNFEEKSESAGLLKGAVIRSYTYPFYASYSRSYSLVAQDFASAASTYSHRIESVTITGIHNEYNTMWQYSTWGGNNYYLTVGTVFTMVKTDCCNYYLFGPDGNHLNVLTAFPPNPSNIHKDIYSEITFSVKLKPEYGGTTITGNTLRYNWISIPFDINWMFQVVQTTGYMNIKVNGTTVVNATTTSSGVFQAKVGDAVFVEVYSNGNNGYGMAITTGSIDELRGQSQPYYSDSGTASLTWENGTISGVAAPEP